MGLWPLMLVESSSRPARRLTPRRCLFPRSDGKINFEEFTSMVENTVRPAPFPNISRVTSC
jgi:hypothetical protein